MQLCSPWQIYNLIICIGLFYHRGGRIVRLLSNTNEEPIICNTILTANPLAHGRLVQLSPGSLAVIVVAPGADAVDVNVAPVAPSDVVLVAVLPSRS